MKRVSLRIEAIAMALESAGFIDVFRYFLAAGQSAEESFASAQRVFRGVPLDGGCAFTTDAVYLRGLVGVHTLDRKSVVWGKSVSVRIDLGGRRIIKKKKHTN